MVNSSSKKKSTLVDTVLKDLDFIGRKWAWIKFFLMMILGLVLLALGISLLNTSKNYKYTGKIKARVESSQCVVISHGSDDTSPIYDCNVQLSYTVDGTAYSQLYTFEGVKSRFVQGDYVNIYYNPSNPNEISEDSSPRTAGWVLISLAVLLLVGAPIYLWVVLHFKAASVVAGGEFAAAFV